MSVQSIAAQERSPLFTFVVVADTHVNEAERMSTSPYETNHRSNPRARHVFTEIAAMRPAPRFVVHLGDIAHDLLAGREAAVSDLRASMMRDTPGREDALHVVLAQPG